MIQIEALQKMIDKRNGEIYELQCQVISMQQSYESAQAHTKRLEKEARDLRAALFRQRREAQTFRALVEQVEYAPDDDWPSCPWCHAIDPTSYTQSKGHRPDCPRQTALQLSETKESE